MTRVDYITGACFPISIFGPAPWGWKQLHLSTVLTILLYSTLYPLVSAAYILWALCYFRWHIYKGIRLLVKSLIVGTLIEYWSRTISLCLRTAALLLFTNQGVHLQHLWFSSISYWTSLSLVSAGAACLTSSILRQLDSTSFSFGYSHRRPSQ